MVTQQGSDPVYNLLFTEDIKDLRGYVEKPSTTKGSLMGLIDKNKDFSIFYYMIQLAQLEGILNDIQANFTIFIPSDTYIEKKYPENIFINMDKYTAREIVLYHILNGKITYETLLSSKGMYLDTRIDPEVHATILLENYHGVLTLNNNARIITQQLSISQPGKEENSDKNNIVLNNGIIHIIDDILIPPAFLDSFARTRAC